MVEQVTVNDLIVVRFHSITIKFQIWNLLIIINEFDVSSVRTLSRDFNTCKSNESTQITHLLGDVCFVL